jgi:hypothetical protein
MQGAPEDYDEVLAQVHAGKEQGDPVGPYRLGDDPNKILEFLAGRHAPTIRVSVT